ncbi:hypothetical protein BDZ91DRAFT_202051 [Kalaharituber pfeilii]|nr:hypothetical protein BDZ91DRAFT_202051 [Kalaharituber pfeilii]
MAAQLPASQTSPIDEFRVFWTSQKKQKLKKWQDGLLRFHTYNKKMIVYDETRTLVCDMYLQRADRVYEGDELEFEHHLVTVEEYLGMVVQDLSVIISPIIERRQQRQQLVHPQSPVYPRAGASRKLQVQDAPTARSLPRPPSAPLQPTSIGGIGGTEHVSLTEILKRSKGQHPNQSANVHTPLRRAVTAQPRSEPQQNSNFRGNLQARESAGSNQPDEAVPTDSLQSGISVPRSDELLLQEKGHRPPDSYSIFTPSKALPKDRMSIRQEIPVPPPPQRRPPVFNPPSRSVTVDLTSNPDLASKWQKPPSDDGEKSASNESMVPPKRAFRKPTFNNKTLSTTEVGKNSNSNGSTSNAPSVSKHSQNPEIPSRKRPLENLPSTTIKLGSKKRKMLLCNRPTGRLGRGGPILGDDLAQNAVVEKRRQAKDTESQNTGGYDSNRSLGAARIDWEAVHVHCSFHTLPFPVRKPIFGRQKLMLHLKVKSLKKERRRKERNEFKSWARLKGAT